MREIDPKELTDVIGGATAVARRRTNSQVQLAVTQMASDFRYAARQRQKQTAMAPVMMAAVIARSRMA